MFKYTKQTKKRIISKERVTINLFILVVYYFIIARNNEEKKGEKTRIRFIFRLKSTFLLKKKIPFNLYTSRKLVFFFFLVEER